MPHKERAQLQERLRAIAADPTMRHPGVETMQGKPPGRFRVRQGDWRAIFSVDGPDVVVERVGNCGEVYR